MSTDRYYAHRMNVSTGEQSGKPILIGEFDSFKQAAEEWAYLMNRRGSGWSRSGTNVYNERKAARFEWHVKKAVPA